MFQDNALFCHVGLLFKWDPEKGSVGITSFIEKRYIKSGRGQFQRSIPGTANAQNLDGFCFDTDLCSSRLRRFLDSFAALTL